MPGLPAFQDRDVTIPRYMVKLDFAITDRNSLAGVVKAYAGALELKLAPVRVEAVIERTVQVVRDRLLRARLNLDMLRTRDRKDIVLYA